MAMASKEVSLLFHLISIPSISGHEGKACSYLASQLPSLGWDDTYMTRQETWWQAEETAKMKSFF